MMNCPACKQAMPNTDVAFDLNTGKVAWPGGFAQLTPQQAEIFHVLWEARPEFIHRDRVCARVAGANSEGMCDNILTVQVCHIRARLKKAGAPVEIEGRHTVGYRVVA